jgi:thioredoxin reductase
METDFEALVVGGAAAGLSAALGLGRARLSHARRRRGEPSNRSAPAIGGLLGQDGTRRAELDAAGRGQLTGCRRWSSARAS